jgi:hypothetical protein
LNIGDLHQEDDHHSQIDQNHECEHEHFDIWAIPNGRQG